METFVHLMQEWIDDILGKEYNLCYRIFYSKKGDLYEE